VNPVCAVADGLVAPPMVCGMFIGMFIGANVGVPGPEHAAPAIASPAMQRSRESVVLIPMHSPDAEKINGGQLRSLFPVYEKTLKTCEFRSSARARSYRWLIVSKMLQAPARGAAVSWMRYETCCGSRNSIDFSNRMRRTRHIT
jgi:hypothetical protein